jgi:cell migration-inducing and hyaluronan-binding protein
MNHRGYRRSTLRNLLPTLAGVIIGLALGALALRVVFASADAGANVAISGFAYAPRQATVRVGETVTWTNNDSAQHTVTADGASFNSGALSQGGVYSRTFDATGVYSYSCAIHPSMVGSVRVISETRVYVPLTAREGQVSAPPAGPPSGPPASAANSGKWSDAATWGGALPQAGAAVTIPSGKAVTLDVSPPPLASLMIEGQLIFDEGKDLNLSANWIMVHGNGGKLQIGSEQAPYLKKAVITLTGNNANEDIMGMGAKFLGAMMGGAVELQGQPKTPWTRLAATANADAANIQVLNAQGWLVGDRIAIAPTDLDPLETEERTITAINGTTLTLDKPLAYVHWGKTQTLNGFALDMRAEVGNLSRNIVVRGGGNVTVPIPGKDPATGAPRISDGIFGGHMMFMDGAQARLSHVEVTAMGQQGKAGRYPIHFHLIGDGGQSSYVKGVAIHHTFQRGLVLHQTHKLLVQDNVIFDTVGHQYFLEDGNEHLNRFDGNLGLLTRYVVRKHRLSVPDGDDRAERQAAFWITNAHNTFTNNVAAGVINGWGFIYAPDDKAARDVPNQDTPDFQYWQGKVPMLEFSGNIAHTVSFLEDLPDGGKGVFNLGYGPEEAGSCLRLDNVPYSDDVWKQSAPITAFFAYKCRNAAVWDDNLQPLTGVVSADSRAAFLNSQGRQSVMQVKDSLVVAKSENNPPGRVMSDVLTSGPFGGPTVAEATGSPGVTLTNVITVGQFLPSNP